MTVATAVVCTVCWRRLLNCSAFFFLCVEGGVNFYGNVPPQDALSMPPSLHRGSRQPSQGFHEGHNRNPLSKPPDLCGHHLIRPGRETADRLFAVSVGMMTDKGRRHSWLHRQGEGVACANGRSKRNPEATDASQTLKETVAAVADLSLTECNASGPVCCYLPPPPPLSQALSVCLPPHTGTLVAMCLQR